MHLRGGESQPVQDAGTEVLDHDVGAFQQFAQHCPPVVALQVQGDGFLVAVAGQEVRGLRIVLGAHERRPPAAGVVPGAGVLDLDDPRAEVSQHHAGVRAGEGAAQVHHEVAGEGAFGVGHGFGAHGGVPSLVGRGGCAVGCAVADVSAHGYIQPGTTMTSQAMAGPAATTMPL